jgi:hypothetical protein
MAHELPTYASPTVIVPQSGIQFLDFAFDLARHARLSAAFWEEPRPDKLGPDGQPLVLLRKLTQDAEGNLVFWDDETRQLRTAPEDTSYRISAAKALEAFAGQWLPFPLLHLAERGPDGRDSFRQGPTTWARLLVQPVTPARAGDPTHRVVLALETKLQGAIGPEEMAAGRPYHLPSEEDAATGATFRFADDHAENAWFLNLPWVAEWLAEAFKDHKQALKPGRPVGPDDFPYVCEHWARYATLIDLLKEAISVPDLKLADTHSASTLKPIDVDLVLDVGNSRTCGLLFESLGESFSMRNAYVLALRDLSRPWLWTEDPFESRIEFARPFFGRDHIRTGRPDLFHWPSLVRVGPEAARLASEIQGTEGATGLSSPKRYLWDTRRARQPWRLNTAEAPFWEKDAEIGGAVTALVTEEGEVISALPARPGELPPVSAVLPLFSRSALYAFMLAEILLQALMMINAPGTRARRQHADVPRRLRRLVLTLPPATPLAEQRILKQRVEGAIQLIWELLGWDLSDSALHERPQVKVDWDEASCTQLVYLYTEITQKLQTTARDFFQVMGKARPDAGVGRKAEPTLRVASIDIGGGTTDLMIITYGLEGDRAMVPLQNFREGFRVAGDDVLEAVVEHHVLPAIARALKAAGLDDADEFLARLFAADRAGQAEQTRLARAVFVAQVLAPVGLALLGAYERLGPNGGPPVAKTLADCFAGRTPPTAEARAYLEAEAALRVSGDFSLDAVEFVMVPEEIAKTVEAVMEAVLSDLCEVVHAYDCDLVLLSGRPSRLPALTEFVKARMPVPPDRVIPMHSYRAGEWYPFGDSKLRVADPKTTAAVGAMLCAVAEGQLEAFSLRTDRLRMRSTARYIGEMEINGQVRKELFANIDLDQPGTQQKPCEVELFAPIFLGFRQLPIARWTATPLYYLEFRNPEEASRLPRPLKVTLERRDARREEDREASLEDFRVVEVLDAEGGPRRNTVVNLRLQTLKSEAGYWLDTGVLAVS